MEAYMVKAREVKELSIQVERMKNDNDLYEDLKIKYDLLKSDHD